MIERSLPTRNPRAAAPSTPAVDVAPSHLSLSQFLAPLVAAIKNVATSVWVAAEISEISDTHHVYITLVETDANGTRLAQLKVSLWASGKAKLIARFEQGTGGEKLRKGLKVLLKLKPTLHPLYGIGATIEDIDPNYTLGEAARKLIELRERLVTEGLYDRQRQLQTPTEFTTIAVVCPAGAAGLGDFQSHADPLMAAGLCRFTYYSATFQGDRASTEIVTALRAVYVANKESSFDAVIILRGGGAQADLAWLNDYNIAAAISKIPLPVFVAVGHERDNTILDEIANVTFHTPSKVINHITGTILGNAQEALKNFDAIIQHATKTCVMASQVIDADLSTIKVSSTHQVRTAMDTVTSCRHAITAGANQAINLTLASLDQSMATLKDGSRRQVDQAGQAIDKHMDAIIVEVDKAVATVESNMSAARQTIYGAAMKGIAVAESEISNHRLAIKERSFLAVQTITDRMRSTMEFIIGLGPEKTLGRGFLIARKDGKPVTRGAQIGAGDQVELQFADRSVGARIN
ncbi:MAG: exodeoxyribonuclease VII large subunit [Sterolibacterium sp.]|jgi:exodeoxyribonuclease VII large subunit